MSNYPDLDAIAKGLVYDGDEETVERFIRTANDGKKQQLIISIWRQLTLAVSEDAVNILDEEPFCLPLQLWFSAIVLTRREMVRAVASGSYTYDSDEDTDRTAQAHLDTLRNCRNPFELQQFFVELERILRDNPSGEYKIYILPSLEIEATILAAEELLKLNAREDIALADEVLYRVRLCLEMAKY